MKTPKLKRCPFCDGEAYLSTLNHLVICKECEVMVQFEQSNRTKAWNQRVKKRVIKSK